MPIKESVKEFVERTLKDARIDIDVEYCKKHNIKFKDNETETEDEIWARLADSERNKTIFEFIFKKV